MLEWLTNKSTQSFAAGIAKVQLKTLRSIQSDQPGIKGRRLYEQALALRPFYNPGKIESVIKEAEEAVIRRSTHLSFRDVVESLIVREYFGDRLVSAKDATAMMIINEVVRDTIPAEL